MTNGAKRARSWRGSETLMEDLVAAWGRPVNILGWPQPRRWWDGDDYIEPDIVPPIAADMRAWLQDAPRWWIRPLLRPTPRLSRERASVDVTTRVLARGMPLAAARLLEAINATAPLRLTDLEARVVDLACRLLPRRAAALQDYLNSLAGLAHGLAGNDFAHFVLAPLRVVVTGNKLLAIGSLRQAAELLALVHEVNATAAEALSGPARACVLRGSVWAAADDGRAAIDGVLVTCRPAATFHVEVWRKVRLGQVTHPPTH